MPVDSRLAKMVVLRSLGEKISQNLPPPFGLFLGLSEMENFRILDVATDIKDQECRQNAQPEEDTPGLFGRQPGIDRPEGNRCRAPTDRPATLNQTNGLAAMLGLDHFGDQNRADRPFAAEAEALHGACEEQLFKGVGEAGKKGEEGEPHHRPLQDTNATVFVGQDARCPAADGRGDQRTGGDIAGLYLAHRPDHHQGGNQKGVNHVIESVDAVAGKCGNQGLPFFFARFLYPHGMSPIRLRMMVCPGSFLPSQSVF